MSSVMRGLKWLVVSVTLALIACGGDPGAPPDASMGAAVESGPFTLTVDVDGTGSGTVSGQYVDLDGTVVPLAAVCSGYGVCIVGAIPAGAAVTLAGAAASPDSSFTGFQEPYCSVYACDWSDPAFEPPSQYAWSAAPYTFAMDAPTIVSARFTLKPPTQYPLTVYVSGSTAQGVIGTANGSPIQFPSQCDGTTVRKCQVTVAGGAVVTLTGSLDPTKVQFQRPYCDVFPAYCNAMLAANPDWYPRPTMVWALAPYTFKVTGPKNVGARVFY